MNAKQVPDSGGERNVIARAFKKIRALWESAVEEVREEQNKSELSRDARQENNIKRRKKKSGPTKWFMSEGNTITKGKKIQGQNEEGKVAAEPTTDTPRKLRTQQNKDMTAPNESAIVNRKRRRDDWEDKSDAKSAFRRTSRRLEKAKSQSPRPPSNNNNNLNKASPKRTRSGLKTTTTTTATTASFQQDEDADELTLMTLSPVHFSDFNKPEAKH